MCAYQRPNHHCGTPERNDKTGYIRVVIEAQTIRNKLGGYIQYDIYRYIYLFWNVCYSFFKKKSDMQYAQYVIET